MREAADSSDGKSSAAAASPASTSAAPSRGSRLPTVLACVGALVVVATAVLYAPAAPSAVPAPSAADPAPNSAAVPAAKPSPNSPPSPPYVFSQAELKPFDGRASKTATIYIAIIGNVYDVTAGRKFYGPGREYSHFAGRDATKAFATGDSSPEGLTDSVEGMEMDELQSIAGWKSFYDEHAEYTFKGVVEGRYYAADGTSLDAFPWAKLKAHETASAERKAALPDCNSKWAQATGSEVWCTTRSGGVEREWVGKPRKYQPTLDPAMGENGAGERERCVCAPPDEIAKAPAYLLAYDGCAPDAERCVLGTTNTK